MHLHSISDPTSIRIAMYGLTDEWAGSATTAHYHVVERLLKRGYQVDFFNKPNYVYPKKYLGYDNFRYINCRVDRTETVTGKIGSLAPALRLIVGQILHRVFVRDVVKAMRREHRSHPYHLQLFLGTNCFGRLDDVPVISWLQGPPLTDAMSISQHKRQIIELCGRLKYWQLRTFAAVRKTVSLPRFANTDYFIVGSQWSVRTLAAMGVPIDRITSHPYAMDVDGLQPDPPRPPHAEPVLCWLGRVVPRKRLDLFLDAAALLIDRGIPVRLKFAGGFAFVPCYRKLLQRFKYPDRLQVIPQVARQSIAEFIKSSDMIVQPSENEDCASTPLEGLCLGVPSVLGPTNGTADYMGEAVERFAEQTAASVAAAIERLLARLRTDPAAVSRAAREMAEKNLVFDQAVTCLERVFASALASPSSARDSSS